MATFFAGSRAPFPSAKRVVWLLVFTFITINALIGPGIVRAETEPNPSLPPKGKRTVANVLQGLEPVVRERFEDLDALCDGRPIALVAFKYERVLELWKDTRKGWQLVKRYPFTAFSGQLGPKLKEGDLQIPEGLYRISWLNPNSSYHLSLKVDYPNARDRARARAEGRTNLGGDIFIHGDRVTVGCIPLGDAAIEEVFYVIARNGYGNTEVILSPYDMRTDRHDPEIASVEWETERYDRIAAALKRFTPRLDAEAPTSENGTRSASENEAE